MRRSTKQGVVVRSTALLASAFVFLAILLVPAIALAQGESEPTALDNLSSELLNVLIPVFVAFIGGLFTWLLHKFQKKTGIELGAAAEAAWSNLARRAALRGAEYARKKAKDLTEGKKIPGPDVLEVSANWALDMAKAFKLPELGREKLEGLIEANLFELRREEAAPVAADPGMPQKPPPRV